MGEIALRKKYTDRRAYCIFCENDVAHFARHMIKWHEQEFDVERILSFRPKSKDTTSFIKFDKQIRLLPVKGRQSKGNLD